MNKRIVGNKKRIYYVVSHIHKSLAFEWISVRLKDHYDITFVLLNTANSALEDFLRENNIRVIRLPYGKKKLPIVFFRLVWILVRERPAVVHAHLFDATFIGLTAAWVARIRRRIYTRHNSTYHHLYHPRAVKYDRWTNFLATEIISISQATDKVLIEQENVSLRKIVKIPHGFDFNDFIFTDPKRVQSVKEKWKIPPSGPRIGVVARHIEWKGIQYIIPAFKEFLKSTPEASLILANASGPHHATILDLLRDIPSKNIILIPFEEDIASLYKSFDIYIHTPIDSTCEAFGQTYVEALASGVPSVFSLSGIAKEFIEHEENAWVVDFKNAEAVQRGMEKLWGDKELRHRLIENGRHAVISRFEIDSMIVRLMQLYDK